MRNTSFLGLAAVVSALAGFLTGGEASAQTTWERLESRIRQQLREPPQDGQPEVVPAPPANAAAGANPAPRLAAQPAAQPGDKPQSEAGKPFLGILADDRNDRGRGIRVLKVFSGGSGEKAGVQEQDLITALAEVRVRQMTELAEILELYAPGDRITVDVVRDGQPKKLQLTLMARPANEGPAVPPPAPGASATPSGPELLPATPPPLTPPPPAPLAGERPGAEPSASHDQTRIIALERRVAELERRIQELERKAAPK